MSLSPTATQQAALSLASCKGCGAVGLVEQGEPPICARCAPNAFAIHLAEATIQRASERGQ